MAKISKAKIKKHNEACALLDRGNLSMEERIFVMEHWHEGLTHDQSWAGAFFTPWELARDFRIEASAAGLRVLDLCAGIGILSYFTCIWGNYERDCTEIVCVERNTDYYEVGKKLLPEARWINF